MVRWVVGNDGLWSGGDTEHLRITFTTEWILKVKISDDQRPHGPTPWHTQQNPSAKKDRRQKMRRRNKKKQQTMIIRIIHGCRLFMGRARTIERKNWIETNSKLIDGIRNRYTRFNCEDSAPLAGRSVRAGLLSFFDGNKTMSPSTRNWYELVVDGSSCEREKQLWINWTFCITCASCAFVHPLLARRCSAGF